MAPLASPRRLAFETSPKLFGNISISASPLRMSAGLRLLRVQSNAQWSGCPSPVSAILTAIANGHRQRQIDADTVEFSTADKRLKSAFGPKRTYITAIPILSISSAKPSLLLPDGEGFKSVL